MRFLAYAVLQFFHYLGLALLIGGPTFWFLVGRPAVQQEEALDCSDLSELNQTLKTRIRAGIIAGAVIYVLASFGDIARIAWQLSYDEFDFELFRQILSQTQNGSVTVLQVVIAVALSVSAWRLPKLWVAPCLLTAFLAITYAWTGHAASGGTPLLQPLDIVHVLAMGLWGGGLFYFALLPWKAPYAYKRAFLAETTRRFSVVGILSVMALVLSGIYMSKERIYSVNALFGTPFGNAVLWKVGLLVVVLLVAAFNHFLFLPWLEASHRPWTEVQQRRYSFTVRTEAVLLLAILLATGALTTLTPPERPAGLAAPVTEQGEVGPWHYDMLVEPSPDGSLNFSMALADEQGRHVPNAAIQVSIDMLGHVMPTQTARLTPDESGRYKGRIIPPMRGPYRATVKVQADGREDYFFMNLQVTSGVMDVLEEDQQVRISLERVLYSPGEFFFFLGYIALLVVGIVLFVNNVRPPRSDLFLLSAVLSIAFGLWGIGTMVQIKAFPTTYVRNPVPLTAEVLERGRELYERHCMVCHGPEGRGDGIAAPGLQPPPSDLTNWTMYRAHTEGDLYWFVTYGIPRTAMPMFQGILTQEERWTVVRYIRQLARDQRIGK